MLNLRLILKGFILIFSVQTINTNKHSLFIQKLRQAVLENKMMDYLKHYGYLQHDEYKDERLVRNAVKRFQEMSLATVTGDVNEETSKKMDLPRCGLADEYDGDTNHPTTKFSNHKRRTSHPYLPPFSGYRWKRRHLTYKFQTMTSDLPEIEIRRIVKRAFNSWKQYTSLTFTEFRKCDTVDISIGWGYGYHNYLHWCSVPFYEEHLAHAYFPYCATPYPVRAACGDIHFDKSEKWQSQKSRGGFKLHIVAAHEIGHALGLGHSKSKFSIMYPIYNPAVFEPKELDIIALQQIYGDDRHNYTFSPDIRDNIPVCAEDQRSDCPPHNERTHMCCGGKISRRPCGPSAACCGTKAFCSLDKTCCEGRDLSVHFFGCCNDRAYYLSKHRCCNGVVIPKYKKCIRKYV